MAYFAHFWHGLYKKSEKAGKAVINRPLEKAVYNTKKDEELLNFFVLFVYYLAEKSTARYADFIIG